MSMCRVFSYVVGRGIPYVQGQRSCSKVLGTGVGSCMVLEQLWGEMSHLRAKEKSQQDGSRGEIMFRLESHTCHRCSEGWNKPYVHQDSETPQRLIQNSVWVSPGRYGSAVGCCRGRGSGCSRPGCGKGPLGRGHHWPHHRATRTYTGLGNRLLEGTNKTQDPGERSSDLISCPFHYRGLECKSRKSRDTWNNRQIWPWSTEESRAKANKVLPRECTGHRKHPLPTNV